VYTLGAIALKPPEIDYGLSRAILIQPSESCCPRVFRLQYPSRRVDAIEDLGEM
jgi:hypothetical protein